MLRVVVVATLAVGAMFLQGAAEATTPPPPNPALAGTIWNATSLSGAAYVAVSGNYAYTLAYYAGTVTVVDISNPNKPSVVGQSPYADSLLSASHMVISGHYAYVVSQNRNGPSGSNINDDGTGNALTILDISNPTAPTIVGTVHSSTVLFGAHGVAVSGSYAYVAAQGCLNGQPCPTPSVGNSLAVIDISNPANPQIVASISNSSLPAPWTGTNALKHACSISVSGNYAYITASYAGRLTAIDISNPLKPTIAASIQNSSVPGNTLPLPVDVVATNGYAYIANEGSSGPFTIVDVHTPTSPQVLGSLTSSAELNGAYRVAIRGYFAYVAAAYSDAVAVVDISDPTQPRLADAYTSTTQLNHTVGVALDPTTQYAVVTSPWLSTQTRHLYPPFPFQPGGPVNTGTVNLIQLDPAPIGVTITSEPTNATGATTASFAFQPSDNVSTTRCQLDGGVSGLCTTATSQSYSGLAAGTHTFTVQTIDAAGNTATASYSWTIVPQAPANTQPPQITGTAAVGQQLQASPGTWTGTPAPTFTYQWQRCDSSGNNCNPISGATNATYNVTSTDAGLTLDVAITGTNGSGSAQAVSAATAVVTQTAQPPANTQPPQISGTIAIGQQLVASPGSWTGTPTPTFTYQWQRCGSGGTSCNAISGATAATYTIASADAGSTLDVLVTGKNSAGSAQAASAATGVVPSSGSGFPLASAPTTPALDNFNRANGPVGSNWTVIKSGSFSTMNTTSNVATDPGSASQYAWNYWNAAAFGPDAEAYASVATYSGNDTLRIGARVSVAGGSYSGYFVSIASNGTWSILRVTTGTATTLASGATDAIHTGDQIGIRIVGSVITALHRTTTNGWVAVLTYDTANDATHYTAAGYTAVEFRTSRIDDFGGGVVTQAPANTQPPQISGTASVGQQLQASPGTWAGTPTPTFTYQWLSCDSSGNNCNPIPGATAATYTVASGDAGSTLDVDVTGTNSGGSAQALSAATLVVGQTSQPPANTQPPQISGTASVGQQLQADPGQWAGMPAPTFNYQWLSCDSSGSNCNPIADAIDPTYTIGPADAGTTLAVSVTAINTAGSTQAVSAVTAIVTQAPANTLPPQISGTAAVGQQLQADPGQWAGTPAPMFGYQWLSCDSNGNNCNPIQGANYATYTVAPADAGATLEVLVTASNSVGSSQATSAPTAVVPQPPANAQAPQISGTASVGQQLLASPGTWTGTPTPTFTYQWLGCDSAGNNCKPIQGATAATYTVAPADAGSTLAVAVTGGNAAGSAQAVSAATGVVTQPPANSQPPQISGTASVGQQLLASPGTWTGTPAPTFAYQWLSCDSSGNNCNPIQGGTAAAYRIANTDGGTTLAVAVTGSNSGGSAQAVSAVTGVVTQLPANTQPPQISGTTMVGQDLQAAPGQWTGTPAPNFGYQWQRCDSNGNNCNPISGATTSSYTAAPADAASTLVVLVTGSNSVGSSQAASAATGVVAQQPQAPTNSQPPQITGTAAVGQQLQASPGQWTGTPAPSFGYQWLSCDSNGNNCKPISGATTSSYTAAPANAGSTLEVLVTGSNSAGSSQAASAATALVAQQPANMQPPQISGTASVGQQLQAVPGQWAGTPAPTFAYQWQQCDSSGNNCNPISGATTASYTVASADGGATLVVAVTGTNTAGSSQAVSAATSVVTQPPSNTGAPQISGTVAVGQQLLASPGAWRGTPAPGFSYQWQRCDGSGSNCNPISGANSATYTIASVDVGSTLNVIVTATNSIGSIQAVSAATSVVATALAPTTPVLDNFNRPNGAVGSNWTVIKSGSFSTMSIANGVAVNPGSATKYAWNYWNASTFGPDSEAYATVANYTGNDTLRIGARVSITGTSYNGYFVSIATDGTWSILRIANGVPTTLATGATDPITSGDQIGIRIVGSVITALHKKSAGWSAVLSYDTSGDTIRYSSAGWLAFEFRTSTFDNFGGGAI